MSDVDRLMVMVIPVNNVVEAARISRFAKVIKKKHTLMGCADCACGGTVPGCSVGGEAMRAAAVNPQKPVSLGQ